MLHEECRHAKDKKCANEQPDHHHSGTPGRKSRDSLGREGAFQSRPESFRYGVLSDPSSALAQSASQRLLLAGHFNFRERQPQSVLKAIYRELKLRVP
jgi:hypothetical protein